MIWGDELPIRGYEFSSGFIKQSTKKDVSPLFSFFCPPLLRKASYIISFFLDHPGPTLVSHPCLYLSARPISHSFWRSASYGGPGSTAQGSCPHKWGQDVSCGYLMRRWQPSLELLLHHASMAGPLRLCFPLGHSRRLPLGACRFLLPWSWLAENRIVLGNISWQFEHSLFVLGHFFLLGMGLRLDVKWVVVAKLFGPTIAPQNPTVQLLGWGGGFRCPQGLCDGRSSLVPLWAPKPLCLPNSRSWRFGVRGALSLILLWSDADRFGIRGAHSLVPLWSYANLVVEGSLGN